ncbi:hypothetical protein BOTBODRAFT_32183 [Botryobasidium botryosum FD-172 SS1]|uniref:Exportin-T n=1 Tax=Botryobasidium botryosum (strain FD-172 SS1) TaxID=930990 RepID=A0A067MGC9_BOTB1|nr:hypothetical protein BOTBODRAFT_32183 [Botryobasidium botryosum FD-172 SS1]
MDQQILSAISIASDPRQEYTLQGQAIEFLQSVRERAPETWQVALRLFLETDSNGGRLHSPQVRVFALQVIDDLLEKQSESLDSASFAALEQAFVEYIQSEYIFGAAEASGPFIRNKFSHTLALLFLCTYPEQWPTFFTSIFSLLRSPDAASIAPLNPHISTLFLRLLIEISGEVNDQTLKAARTFDAARHARDAKVRDEVRSRDAAGMSEAVLAIIAEGEERLAGLRSQGGGGPEIEKVQEAVEYGVKAFAGIVPWVDINLTVTPHTLPLLFRLLSDPDIQIRLSATHVILRIVQKGLKEPSDKLNLIRVLSLGEVLESLEEKTRSKTAGEEMSDDEVSYREGLGKLTSGLGQELAKLSEDMSIAAEIRGPSEQLLDQLLPVMLRFLADDYDETSTTVFPLVSAVLGIHKRAKKNSPQMLVTEPKRAFLSSTLEIVLQKMKWDADDDPYDMDDDEKAAFETMRKDLRSFLDAILYVDTELTIGAVRQVAMNALNALKSGTQIKWEDAELAVYLVYLFGELQKSSKEKGRLAFIQAPPDVRENKERRKEVDYSLMPLTLQGELMLALVQSGVSTYPNLAVTAQFFETVARYGDFFKVRKECIVPVLTDFLDVRGIHTPKTELRGRYFYLFHRFIKDVRQEIPSEHVPPLLDTIRDLLLIEVEAPEDDRPDIDSLEDDPNVFGIFDSQLYLFESVGTLLSLLGPTPTDQAVLLGTVTTPLLTGLSQAIQAHMNAPQALLHVLQAHHHIRALGSISKGFPDAPVPTPPGYVPAPWVAVFKQAAEAILVCLEAMNSQRLVRDATRFAFGRIIASTGAATTQYIPTLMGRLLSQFEPPELVEFIMFLGLVVHKLQTEVFDVIDELLTPLNNHISTILAQPIDGTDAKQMHLSTKKAYLEFLGSIMSGPLFTVFISERNNSQFVNLMESIISVASDPSDPVSEKVAFTLLARCTAHFGTPASAGGSGVPGFERLIYERLIPLAFDVPASPNFNIKDGQTLSVLVEIGVFLKATHKARSQEVLDFLVNVFLPSKNCPPEMANDFVAKLRDLDTKGFKKYWADFFRASQASS